VIAESHVCFDTPGATEIQFTEPAATVRIEHFPHLLYPCKTEFIYDGKKFHWIGHSELVEEQTGDVLAQFHTSWHLMEGIEHKLGKLIIKHEGLAMTDLIVITALIVQERSEEGRLAVKLLTMCAESRSKWQGDSRERGRRKTRR